MLFNNVVSISVVVEWIALLVRIRKVPVSNVGPTTSYPDKFFVVSLSPSREMLG
jgi:hypothetical protein